MNNESIFGWRKPRIAKPMAFIIYYAVGIVLVILSPAIYLLSLGYVHPIVAVDKLAAWLISIENS